MRLLDLFSGIGGFSLGLERAGFQTVAFCEVAPACRHLLAHHWPGVPCYDDVRNLTAARLAADGVRVDAICGGFPCQDISFAGAGAGIEGARSGLWREYARLVGEFRPRLVFVENVAALLGRGLGVVLGDLAALGYDAWWDCIPAAAVGAPHRRDRLWLVAYPRGQQHEGYGDALRRAVAEGLSGDLAHANDDGRDHVRAREEGQQGTPLRAALASGEQRADRSRRLVECAAGVAHAEHRGRQGREPHGAGAGAALSSGPALADTDLQRSERRGLPAAAWWRPGADALGCGARIRRAAARQSCRWSAEPDVGRVAHGVPARVDRLHGLGNAVVPQIPELLGRAALAALSDQGRDAA